MHHGLHLPACSGDKYCMASACICKLESILLFSGNIKCLYGSKFLKTKIKLLKLSKASQISSLKSNWASKE